MTSTAFGVSPEIKSAPAAAGTRRAHSLNCARPHRPLMDAIISQINALNIPSEWKELLIAAITCGVHITVDRVVRIWSVSETLRIPGLQQPVLWIEDNSPAAGYQHMLAHANEFRQLGISEEQLGEVAEAATTVGYPGGQQGGSKKGPGRPIFALAFYGKLVAVAISVGSNGFVVGMNRSSLEQFLERTGVNRAELEDLASWPNVTG
ncbi:hypothetical protein RJZ56_007922 [Blastomyces dermatitidis]